MVRRVIRPMLALVVGAFALVAFSPAALAQSVIEVERATTFTLENGRECAPNSDVNVFFGLPEEGANRIGVTVSDEFGHYSLPLTLPGSAPLGAGVITVDCGIEGSVLVYDVVVVEPETFEVMDYAPIGAAVLGAIAVIGMLMLVVKRRSSKPAEEVEPVEEPPAPAAFGLPVPDDKDDDPEYWFWDADTDRGPAKRLACLTDTAFYLHEVPAAAFTSLLEKLAALGPDDALERAFFRVAVDDIDEVRHHRTEIRISHRTPSGFVAKTIDLATEVDEVVNFLSRRVPVIAEDAAVSAS
ncbi:MAG: hypothetical protein AAF480_03395 [Actinomycetota bacterium]